MICWLIYWSDDLFLSSTNCFCFDIFVHIHIDKTNTDLLLLNKVICKHIYLMLNSKCTYINWCHCTVPDQRFCDRSGWLKRQRLICFAIIMIINLLEQIRCHLTVLSLLSFTCSLGFTCMWNTCINVGTSSHCCIWYNYCLIKNVVSKLAICTMPLGYIVNEAVQVWNFG